VLPGLNADAKSGLESRPIVCHHERDFKFIEALRCHRQANQTAAIFRHKVNGFGCDFFRGNGQITLILPIFIVGHDDHLACADSRNGIFDAGKAAWVPVSSRMYKCGKLLRSMGAHTGFGIVMVFWQTYHK